jgi:hypothetical protein
MERPEQLATARATESTTTTTSSKQLVGQTTRAVEPPTSKDAVNVANTEVPEQEPGRCPSRRRRSRWRPSKVFWVH